MKNFDSLGLRVKNGKIYILDQTKLPHDEEWIESKSIEEMVDIIKALKVRGAPLIGVSAACALAFFAKNEKDVSVARLKDAALKLRGSRPTAVNLMNAIDRQLEVIEDAALKPGQIIERIVEVAEEICDEDVNLCEAMALNGVDTIKDGDGILTHCNTGGLATAGIGTALGVIRLAHENGKKIHVYVDETRPLLQGARLTTWELKKLGIPYTLICDNMSAMLMRAGKIQKIYVGADRIAKNGDFANKIGTYGVSVLAKHHGIPFYTVAPMTTVDFNCPTGDDIPIEERHADEVRAGRAPLDAPVFNPSFDVTPNENLTGLILDQGLFTPKQFRETF